MDKRTSSTTMWDAVRGRMLDLAYGVLGLLSYPIWRRKQRGGWSERFGAIQALPKAERPRIMMHAVSVGEVNLIRALVDDLASDVEVLVTVTTDTGMERAQRLFGGREPHVFVRRYPLDFTRCVRRFLDAAAPDAAALVELEIWPNFLRACRSRSIPVAVINGRLSDRSHGRYAMLRPIVGGWFRGLTMCAVQDEQYRTRFLRAGASPDRCVVAGSMKWDSAEVGETIDGAEALATRMGIDRSRPLIVGGSTAPGEHELLHDACPPGAQLLCAPRRPEWFDQAAEALPGCWRFSQSDHGGGSSSDRFLLDTLGELRKAYALADVVVIGRSFGDLYGSDPMEAAALGKPVIIGPAVADFRTIVETMEKAGAIRQVAADELADVLKELIGDEESRIAFGERARQCVLDNQGATRRHAELLRSMVGVSRPA